MSQIKPGRRARSFRRSMIILAAIALAVVGYLYWQSQQDQLSIVRVASVSRQDIASYLNVTASIKPGRISEPTVSGQTVESVLVKAGDQVKAGDVLITFDLEKLQDQYDQAKEMRTKADSAITEAQNLVKKQASTATAQSSKLQKDIDSLSRTISRITTDINTLRSTVPVDVLVSPELEAELKAMIAAYDPSAPDAREKLAAIVTRIQSGVTISQDPTYQAAVNSINKNVSSIDNLFSSIANGAVNVAGTALNPTGMTQTASLYTQAQSAVASAAQAEAMAKQVLEQAKPDLRAEFDGIVVSVNAKTGQTLGGTSGLPLTQSLSQTPAVVLYDNVSPRAVFRANRLDSNRITNGMTVAYEQDGKLYNGEITYIAKVATTGGLSSSSSSSSQSSLLGMGADLTSIGEPMLDIEMSIRGEKLTDLVIGFTIDAQIRTDSASNVPCIPAEALKRELGRYFVFVLRADNTLEQRFITPGIQSDVDAQVLEGLAEGEKVVLSPSNDLKEGLKVVERTGDAA